MNLDYDALAQDYAQHRAVHPGVLKHLIRTANLTSTSRVLDVGCGPGNYLLALQKATGCSCWGVEPSPQMLAQARQRARTARLQRGWAEQLDHPAGTFDLVFSVDVIHHVGDPPAYYRQAHRVLKEGGQVCTVTDSEDLIRRRQPLSVYFPETIDVDLRRYPPISGLRAIMVDARFHDLREAVAEFPYALTSLQSYRDRAFSCLHLIPPHAFQRGIQHMERDLRAGPIPCVARYLLLWGTR
jgi:ubiquinone/menaquinone biosynthesis C-methylase UbiE